MLFAATGSQLVPLDRRNGRRGNILLLHPNTCFLMPQGLSSYHWTEAMAEEATYLYFMPAFTFMLHTCFLMPQGLSTGRRQWPKRQHTSTSPLCWHSCSTHAFCCHRVSAPTTGQTQWPKRRHTSTSTQHMLFDATGSQLAPLDRGHGQRGDILLLHPNIHTHSF